MPPSPSNLEDVYRTAAAVRVAGLTVESSEAVYRAYVEFVIRHAPAGRVVDIGCGTGWSTHWFANRGYDATGVDLNPDVFEPPPYDRLRFVPGSGTALPFPDAAFDAAAANQCLEYVPDKRRMLDEMIRVVRPGGAISHIVDHRDHNYHAQESISPLNHLRYSDRTWNLIARPPFSYTNRLLRSDYLALFATLPLELVYAGWDPHGEFTIRQQDLDARFRARPSDDYDALVSHFICIVEK